MHTDINLMIARINELSRKQRSEGLDEWERAEQESLRQEYLCFIRGQVKNSLDQIKINSEETPGNIDH